MRPKEERDAGGEVAGDSGVQARVEAASISNTPFALAGQLECSPPPTSGAAARLGAAAAAAATGPAGCS